MRTIALIVSGLLLFACVKKPSTSPVPTIEYIDFQAKQVSGHDTAGMVIGYEDGDGDIFRDLTVNGPNFIATFYYFNNGTKTFKPIFPDPITQDTFRIVQTVLQPKDGNYKGKAVKGEIYIPMSTFRSADSVKRFKYTIYMVDEGGHVSNRVTTPEFTVNF